MVFALAVLAPAAFRGARFFTGAWPIRPGIPAVASIFVRRAAVFFAAMAGAGASSTAAAAADVSTVVLSGDFLEVMEV